MSKDSENQKRGVLRVLYISPPVSCALHTKTSVKRLSGRGADISGGASTAEEYRPAEGDVHRLKLIKYSIYGRASFDTLRLTATTNRVLTTFGG